GGSGSPAAGRPVPPGSGPTGGGRACGGMPAHSADNRLAPRCYFLVLLLQSQGVMALGWAGTSEGVLNESAAYLSSGWCRTSRCCWPGRRRRGLRSREWPAGELDALQLRPALDPPSATTRAVTDQAGFPGPSWLEIIVPARNEQGRLPSGL